MNYRSLCEQIFLEGINSVMPQNLIKKHLSLSGNILIAGDTRFDLDTVENVYVIGAGKAGAFMGAAIEEILGNRIRGGHIVTKYGFSHKLKYISVSDAGHPIPDSNGYEATRSIRKITEKAGKNDLVISLFSGGGSALLADLPENCSIDDINELNSLLVNSGADISEINTVRKHLSTIKGGQLARIVSPARLISLMISDVPGNQIDIIASGPTVPDPTTYNQAVDILNRYSLIDNVSPEIIEYLLEGISGLRKETPKPGDKVFKRTINILAGSNKVALEAARNKASEKGLNVKIMTDCLEGEVTETAAYLFDFAMKAVSDASVIKPACFLFGGETTLKMTGNGKGGRNQHLALTIAGMLKSSPRITFLCGGTDGNDGPTDAAGAVVDSETVKGNEPDYQEYLRNFDSYNFFHRVGGHIITGPTHTNVMDLIVLIVS